MNVLLELAAIIGLVLSAGLFWQWRKQAEWARHVAATKLNQLNLQLLELHRAGGRLAWQRGPCWRATFRFDFCSQYEHRYTGSLTLVNLSLERFELPPHRFNKTENETEKEAASAATAQTPEDLSYHRMKF